MDRRFFLRTLLGGVSALAIWPLSAGRGGAQTRNLTPLPIPDLQAGEMRDGVRVYNLNMQRGNHEFFKGFKTPTLGVNASYLGETLRMRAGETIRLNVTNNIGEETTLHWHGMHLPARADGGPHQVIRPGQTWSPEFKIKQEAATFWYHSHMHEKTGEQVWRGLAGMIIVDEEKADELNLPGRYGVDDIPLVLQDRSFDRDGSLVYATSMHDRMMGMSGNVPLVNGAVSPVFSATTEKVRLRLLNASNGSFYNLGFSDNRAFVQIAGDGSLLPTPFETNRVFLGPAERAEIIVDVSDGKNVVLQSFAGGNEAGSSGGAMMGRGMMRRGMMGRGMMGGGGRGFEFLLIKPAENLAASAAVPPALLKVAVPKEAEAVKTRRFSLEMTMGPMMMLRLGNPFAINGVAMDMGRINEVVRLGDTEIWEISNDSFMPHPFHIHDVQFGILDRNGRPPQPGEQGLKDTVIVNPRETVRVIAKFQDYADSKRPYMYHCHILEHEDGGMMGQFTVVG